MAWSAIRLSTFGFQFDDILRSGGSASRNWRPEAWPGGHGYSKREGCTPVYCPMPEDCQSSASSFRRDSKRSRFRASMQGKRSSLSRGETGSHRPDRLLERAAAVWGTAGGARGFCPTRRARRSGKFMINGAVWRGLARFGAVWRGLARLGAVGRGWRGLARFGAVWRGLARFGAVWRGLARFFWLIG